MDNETIKKEIEKIRKDKGLTQEDMADLLGICRNAYRKIEKGSTQMINPCIFDIAQIGGKDPEELVLGYSPLQDSGHTLKDIRDDYKKRLQTIRSEYDNRLEALNMEVGYLRNLVKEKDQRISSLNSIVAMLEKQLDKKV